MPGSSPSSVPGEELVAVGALEPRVAVEGAARAAVRVRDHDVVVARRLGDRRGDPLGPVVQLGRQRAHVEVEAAPLGDRAHVQRQRSARDDDALHAGNES